MDPNLEKLLSGQKRLMEENNHLLRKLASREKWSRITKYIYWLIIIGISAGVFLWLKPYVDQLLELYQSIQEMLANNPISGGVLEPTKELQETLKNLIP